MQGEFGLRNFYNFVLDPANNACGFTCVAQLMDKVQLDRLSWRLSPVASLLSNLNADELYQGTKTERERLSKAAKSDATVRSAVKSGEMVCCPTVFRAHSCCPPVASPPSATTAESVVGGASVGTVAPSSGCDEESLTSASGLQRAQSKTREIRYSHAPSARCVR